MADWDITQARRELGVSESCLRGLVRADRIPHYRVGRLIRFEPAKLCAWKAQGGTAPPAEVDGQEASSAACAPPGRGARRGRTEGAAVSGVLAGVLIGSSAAWRDEAPAIGGVGS